MKSSKPIYIIVILLFLYNCKNTAQNEKRPSSVNIIQGKLVTEKVKNSNRLTENSLLSFFPKTFLNYKEDGIHNINEVKNYAKNSIKFTVTSKPYNHASLSIEVYDYSDDARYSESIAKFGVTTKNQKTKYFESKTYKNADGNYVTESQTNTSSFKDSRVTIQNGRFNIYVVDKKGKNSPTEILNAIKKTKLYQLFELPIPKKKVVENTSITAVKKIEKKVLNCDELLPMSVVKSICNKTVSIKTTSFEKDYNCNRFYPDENSTGALIFLVTQYLRPYTAKSAVKIDTGKFIPNLGDYAIYIKEKSGDEYLKVNYKTYLLELRSTKNFDKEGVCYTEKELVKLMKGIISRL